ncbi:MAG: hypothetical protein HYU66_12435 [Armatimonadetes bacterium]|nr:hypothetical protein [Armatimonadota bacterium]
MKRLNCPYLSADFELTDERAAHIAERHPEVLPAHAAEIAETLADPDSVRASTHDRDAKLFARWFTNIRGGKHVIVVVVGERARGRHWVSTAYVARKLAPGVVEWQRP